MKTVLRMMLFAASVLASLTLTDTGRAATPSSLFFIARSKNANIVQYDANIAADGAFDAKSPVVGYWVMQAEDGRKEPLSRLERELAYGYTTRVDPETGALWLVLVAHKARPIRVSRAGGAVRAEINIAGRRAYLTKIFVQAKDGLIPRVEYVDIFGTDARTGAALSERKTP